ncbi:MAG: hypothetical protein V3V16_09310 [Melioribacteraceae bacterium]
MKHILFVGMISFLLFTSCDNFLSSEEKDGVYLDYLGKSTEYEEMIQFRLINNSNASIEYWGYGSKSPFYNYQIKNDTGWSANMLGWCGTGAGVNELSTNSNIEFRSTKPKNTSVWRLIFHYKIKGLEEVETIYSVPIQN